MSNPNISTRRTTFNKISAESSLVNSPLKSPNFPQSPSKIISLDDDDFEAPKPTKKIKAGKSAENGSFTTPPSSSLLQSSAQFIKKQDPDFLGNIQLKAVDENWEREALKQIKNSSLHKLLNSDNHVLDAFKVQGVFSLQTPLESLKPDEITQLLDKLNQDLKQEFPHFPQLPFGQVMIPDLPFDLQNALDELLYQPTKRAQKTPKKSYIKKTNGAHHLMDITQQAPSELPENANTKSSRKTQLKSKVEKTAAPKELLGKRSPPQTDQEPQRRATRRSQQIPQIQQPDTPPKSKNIPQLEKKDSEEQKVTKKKSSAKQNKTDQPVDKISTDDDSLVEMSYKNLSKKTTADEDAMEIETPIQRIVNLKIGKAHQINPLPLVLNKERPRRQIKKIIWCPPTIETKVYEDYIDQFQKIIEKEITNVEVACKTLIKFDMDINKAIENIKKNVAYYKNQMIPGQRVLRNRFAFS